MSGKTDDAGVRPDEDAGALPGGDGLPTKGKVPVKGGLAHDTHGTLEESRRLWSRDPLKPPASE